MAQKKSDKELDYGAFQEGDAPSPVEPQKTEPFASPIYQQLQTERTSEQIDSANTNPTADTTEFDAILQKSPGANPEHFSTLPTTAAGGTVATAVGPPPTASAQHPDTGATQRINQREEAQSSPWALAKIFQVLLAVFYPLILLAGALRLVASPLLLLGSYQRPGFPADEFGFSTEDRLTFGAYPLDYLYNTADSRYLSELELNGEPMFRSEEVSHMTDVKIVITITMLSALALLILALLLSWYLARRYPGAIRRAFFYGVIGLLVVASAISVIAVLNWNNFFTTFHQIFFPQGNWLFYRDDTLIRLYPEPFWMDAAIAWGSIVLIAIVVTLLATWPTKKRRTRNAAALKKIYTLNTEV